MLPLRASRHSNALIVAMLTPVLLQVSTCERTGVATLVSLEVEVAGEDRMVDFDPSRRRYNVSVPDGTITLRAASADPKAVVSWHAGRTGERLGIGGGEVSLEFGRGTSTLTVLVVSPGGAATSYVAYVNHVSNPNPCVEQEHGLGEADPTAELFETDYIKASNTGEEDGFAHVAICGDTLVVGAPWEDTANDGIKNAGAAYVFQRENGLWSQTEILRSPTREEWGQFGASVALSDDLLAVSAIAEDRLGAVHLFDREYGYWSHVARLVAPNAELNDAYGRYLAIAKDIVVVGASEEDGGLGGVNPLGSDNSLEGAGAAYIFERGDGTWNEVTYLKAEQPQLRGHFATGVAVYGSTVAVGGSGFVRIFDRLDGVWAQTAHVVAESPEGPVPFAGSVSLWRNRLAAAYSREEFGRGAAYVFERQGLSWWQTARLLASNRGGSDGFGRSIALNNNRIAVAAPYEDGAATGINGDGINGYSGGSGATYLFELVDGSWTETSYIKASDAQPTDFFGSSIAMSSRTLAVGSPGEASGGHGVGAEQDGAPSANESGAVYLFAR